MALGVKSSVVELHDIMVHQRNGQQLSVNRLVLDTGFHAVMGADDAGSDSLLDILGTLREPDEGRLVWRGRTVAAEDLTRYRRVMGYMPARFGEQSALTIGEALLHLARLRGIPRQQVWDRIEAVSAALKLPPLGRPLMQLSDGQRQQVGIAQALLHDPEVIICRLPAAGLDHHHWRRVQKALAAYGRCSVVVFTADTWRPVALLNARILLLSQGNLAFYGSGGQFVGAVRELAGSQSGISGELPDVHALRWAYAAWLDAGQPLLPA